MKSAPITEIWATEILDSRGNPTLQVNVELADGLASGTAQVPSGASTGTHEALELRDTGASGRYLGKGVTQAIENIMTEIGPSLIGMDAQDQALIDATLCAIDGTANKARLGANAILGVSLATARAMAQACGQELFEYLGGIRATELPVPLLNVLNGGAHATNGLDIQEFMLVPAGLGTYSEALRAGVETYHCLRKLLLAKGLATGLGDEGGFAPVLESHEAALDLLMAAIEQAGYLPGEHIWLALDCAATEFARDGGYHWNTEGKHFDAHALRDRYRSWCDQYPILSIEDPFAEDDWAAWSGYTSREEGQVQIVGDDLYVTNLQRLDRGLQEHASNAILIKLNQIGTLSETLQVISEAQRAGWGTIISHRSGETMDTFISDLAVGTGAGQIKAGAPARGERVAKYNRLLEIEDQLAGTASYAGLRPYRRYLNRPAPATHV